MKNEEILLNYNVLKILKGPITQFYKKILTKNFVNNTVEIINYHERFDPRYEFFDFLDVRKARRKYMENEHNWYMSLDRSIIGHPGIEGNRIWEQVCSKDEKKEVNSQYGWIVFSKENGANNKSQFENCVENLLSNNFTRQGVIEYMRPSIWQEWNENGKHDFICTFSTVCTIRNNKLHYSVYMRSNSLFTGFVNDFNWHCYVMKRILQELNNKGLNIKLGSIYWSANSFHAYEEDYQDIINIYNRYKELLKQKCYYIYKISNLFNNKIYIGKHYGSILDDYMGSGILITRLIKKHGISQFNKEIIEICNESNIDEKEKQWIIKENSFYPNGYNIDSGGSGGDRITHNPNYDKICKKISEGVKRRNSDPEYRKKQSIKMIGENNPMYKQLPDDVINRILAEYKNTDIANLISLSTNISLGDVKKTLKELNLPFISIVGIKTRGKNNPRYIDGRCINEITKENEQKFLKLYNNRIPLYKISKQLNIGLKHIQKYIKDHNLNRKRPPTGSAYKIIKENEEIIDKEA